MLSPAALNLAWMVAQPVVGNEGAHDQVYLLLAQIISRVSGDLSARVTGGMQLLSAQQRQRSNRLIDDFYQLFAATSHFPTYSAPVAASAHGVEWVE